LEIAGRIRVSDAAVPQAATKTPGDGPSGLIVPKTERGRRTLRALLDAAALEFGANGFHATGITDITRRAGVALGSFYTYFASKEDIFRALVSDLSGQVKTQVAPHVEAAPDALARERAALAGFLDFVTRQQLIYRIIDEAEFVAPDAYQGHYRNTVARIAARLQEGAAKGELREGVGEVEAWAIAGMNVFLGLRYGVWGDGGDLEAVVARAHRLVAEGLGRR
jgi:AcrR family transcriptional regulator